MIIKFEGLDELIKEVEKCASTAAIEKANKKILQECAKKTKVVLQSPGKMPRSSDPMLSGRRGSRTGQHSADNIPISGISNKNAYQSITVGWDKDDNSSYFYTKFTEWGTSKQPAKGYMQKTKDELQDEYSDIAEKAYSEVISKLK